MAVLLRRLPGNDARPHAVGHHSRQTAHHLRCPQTVFLPGLPQGKGRGPRIRLRFQRTRFADVDADLTERTELNSPLKVEQKTFKGLFTSQPILLIFKANTIR